MSVSLQTVYDWESDVAQPTQAQVTTMERLSQQCEAYTEKTALRPALEIELRARRVDQIHVSELTIKGELTSELIGETFVESKSDEA
ncbi:MAG: hypothetical protein RBT63_05905 [Bdellovibrionales bacterium]|nr:hypothetical protein [Bdellovibrionales bacterium]